MQYVIIGTGWLGFPLASKLAEKGHAVWGSSRTVRESFSGNFQSFVYPADASPLHQADAVVLAFPPDRSSPEKYAADCLEVVHHCSPDSQIVMVSSTGAYTQTGMCTEEHIVHDIHAENTLIQAESCLRERVGNRLTIVRLAGLIGPDRYPVRVMAKSGKTYHGNDPVNVIHLEDAVGLLEHVLEQQLTGEMLNGCSEEHPSRRIFYTDMADRLGLPVPIFTDSSGESKIISPAKSKELGYRYRFPDPMHFPL